MRKPKDNISYWRSRISCERLRECRQ